MKIYSLFIGIFLAVMLFVEGVSAQELYGSCPEGRGRGRHQGRNPGAMIEWLNTKADLSDEQRVAVKKLVEETQESRQAERSANRKQMLALLDSEEFDETAASNITMQRSAARESGRLERLRFMHSLRKLLTAEQRKEFDSEIAQHAFGPQRFGGERGMKRAMREIP